MPNMLPHCVALLATFSLATAIYGIYPMPLFEINYDTAIIEKLALNSPDYTPLSFSLDKGKTKLQCLMNNAYGDVEDMYKPYNGSSPRTLLIDGMMETEEDFILNIFDQVDEDLDTEFRQDYESKTFSFQLKFGPEDGMVPTDDIMTNNTPYLPLTIKQTFFHSCRSKPHKLCRSTELITLQFVCSEHHNNKASKVQLRKDPRETVILVKTKHICKHPRYRPVSTPLQCVKVAPWTSDTPKEIIDIKNKRFPVSGKTLQGLPLDSKTIIELDGGITIMWNSKEGRKYRYRHLKDIEHSSPEGLVTMGKFNKHNHMMHKKQHPELHTWITTFHYSKGSICEVTGKPRTTTVMYICDPHADRSLPMLYENEPCDYFLTIRSRSC